MKFLIGFAVLFASSMIFSCSEVSDPSPIVGIDEKLLVNDNGWVVSSSTKDDGKTKQDLLAQYSLCDADNVYKFQNDGEYTINEGDKKCETADPQIKESGYWILKGSSLTF